MTQSSSDVGPIQQPLQLESGHAELDERLRFETLLTDLSAEFVNLSADFVDDRIEEALHRACVLPIPTNL